MRLLDFSFKRESVWMLVFGVAPAIVGLLIMLVVLLSR
jgi:hypothetical protein